MDSTSERMKPVESRWKLNNYEFSASLVQL